MADRNKPLFKCTDDEIEEEASRRRSIRVKNKDKLKFCDDCVHFKVHSIGEEIPDHELMDACSLGHKTKFIMPEHPIDDTYGFYRVACTDREICIDRKWPWQIQQEIAEENKRKIEELSRKAKHKEWNEKLAARKLNRQQK